MTTPAGYHLSTQTCPKCRRPLYQSLAGASLCPWCRYERPAPAPGSVCLGVHGRGIFQQLLPRLEHLTARLQIGRLATLYDSGSFLALEWSLHLEVDLTHYSCGARMGGCAYVIVIGEPGRSLEDITQGVPYRRVDPKAR